MVTMVCPSQEREQGKGSGEIKPPPSADLYVNHAAIRELLTELMTGAGIGSRQFSRTEVPGRYRGGGVTGRTRHALWYPACPNICAGLQTIASMRRSVAAAQN
jgi:hypothetical protein